MRTRFITATFLLFFILLMLEETYSATTTTVTTTIPEGKEDVKDIKDITSKIWKKVSTVMKFHETEYSTGDNATFFLQLLEDEQPVNDGYCFLSAYYPDKTSLLTDVAMTHLSGSDGLYYYDTTLPSQTGVYMLSATCFYPKSTVDFYASGSTINIGNETGSYLYTKTIDELYHGIAFRTSPPSNLTYCHSGYLYNPQEDDKGWLSYLNLSVPTVIIPPSDPNSWSEECIWYNEIYGCWYGEGCTIDEDCVMTHCTYGCSERPHTVVTQTCSAPTHGCDCDEGTLMCLEPQGGECSWVIDGECSFTCEAGWYNANGETWDGCEAQSYTVNVSKFVFDQYLYTSEVKQCRSFTSGFNYIIDNNRRFQFAGTCMRNKTDGLSDRTVYKYTDLALVYYNMAGYPLALRPDKDVNEVFYTNVHYNSSPFSATTEIPLGDYQKLQMDDGISIYVYARDYYEYVLNYGHNRFTFSIPESAFSITYNFEVDVPLNETEYVVHWVGKLRSGAKLRFYAYNYDMDDWEELPNSLTSSSNETIYYITNLISNPENYTEDEDVKIKLEGLGNYSMSTDYIKLEVLNLSRVVELKGSGEAHVSDPLTSEEISDDMILSILEHARILNERVVKFKNDEYCVDNQTLRHNITYDYCRGTSCRKLSDVMDEDCKYGCDFETDTCKSSPWMRWLTIIGIIIAVIMFVIFINWLIHKFEWVGVR